MPTLTEVQQQIEKLRATDLYGTRKEVRYLPEILADDETILALTSGLMDGNTWLIVCTEKRVIFLDKGLIYGLKQVETPLDKINTIEQRKGLLLGSIGIWDGSSQAEIKMVPKATVRPFVDAVNHARDALRATTEHHETQAVAVGTDAASQLERLAALRDRGVLSDDEFKIQKSKIINQ